MKKTLCWLVAALFLCYASPAQAEVIHQNGITKKPTQKHSQMEVQKSTTPVYRTIKNKRILEFSFNPKHIGLDVLVAKNARAVGYFWRQANAKYDNWLFLLPGTYYDPATYKSVGRIITNKGKVTGGVYKHGANLVYDNKAGKLMILDNYSHVDWNKYDMVLGGLASLVKNRAINLSKTKKRDLKSQQRLERVAVGVESSGIAHVVYYTGTLNELAHIMLLQGCKDAVALDAGNSRFLVYEDNLYDRVNRARQLKSVIVGYVRK